MTNTDKKQEKVINPFSEMEEEALDFWNKNEIFEKSVKKEAPKGDYVFYDGPPFATGTPHYGHIVGSIMKDVIPRYWTMQGKRVERKWGWDCHGLPIENIVEKEFGSKSKKDIEAIGVDKFNEMCRSKVLSYVDEWEKVINRLGRWADMKNAYRTMDLDYMESIWWVFKELWDKGLIYEGYRSMHVCPRCETTLSQQEVSENYSDVKDLSATVKFELIESEKESVDEYNKRCLGGLLKTYILAWTTTPWTLIGNVALAVGKDIDYVKVKLDDKIEYCILAKDRLEDVLDKNGKEYEVVKELKGSDLLGLKYKPLFDYYSKDKNLKNHENGWQVYAGDFVTTDEGTGVVHIAPAFGEDDMNLGKEYNLPFIQHLGIDGIIKKEATDFAGKSITPRAKDNPKEIREIDLEVTRFLGDKIFSKEKYEHSYPHCWRCDTALINYTTSSWFVNVTKVKGKALETAKEINWSPAHIKEGRFGKWLEGARDWSISRQRFWASVMPIWKCDKCGAKKVFGSVAELEKASGEKVDDLHKHIIDKVKFTCDECDGEMHRIPDVLDTWFDSGSMPYAQMHYPFENKEKFEKNFPAEFIAEGQDQCRAWFYYLHIIGTAIKESHAFNNVIVNGIVLAEDGKKMSKKLQNYPNPSFVFDQYGADALRYYLLTSNVVQADNLNFSEEGVKEALRKVVMILWNVVRFYDLFVQENGLAEDVPESENVLDKWILVRLNQLLNETVENMNAYNLPRSTRPMAEFVDDLSTWYIRRSRDRFKGEDERDRDSALATTSFVLLELSKIMAPFMPFISEQVWQKVTKNDFQNNDKSVHLEAFPSWSKGIIDSDKMILEKMNSVRKIVESGLSKRDELGIKIRQPLQKLTVKLKGLKIEEAYSDLIKDEVNVKEVIVLDEGENLVVELDSEISEELKLEGMKRELVRLINAMRKKSGLTIKDKISLSYKTDSASLKKTMELFGEEIKKDTISCDIEEKDISGKEVDVNGEKVVLEIEVK